MFLRGLHCSKMLTFYQTLQQQEQMRLFLLSSSSPAELLWQGRWDDGVPSVQVSLSACSQLRFVHMPVCGCFYFVILFSYLSLLFLRTINLF